MGRVLTLVIAPDTEALVEDSIEAANYASREHPCRVILVSPADRLAGEPRLDAQIRVGGDAGAGEVVVLRLSGPLAKHASSVVMPFLLPDTPIVAWWPDIAPEVPARIRWASWPSAGSPTPQTAPTHWPASRVGWRVTRPATPTCAGAESRYWRALLTSAMDQAPHEPIRSAVVSGLKSEPALDILAGWLASRIDGPVTRTVGKLKVELNRDSETITLSRPQEGVTATLSRTGRPDALLPLARRETRDCLSEDLRRLDADDIYREALQGLDKVQYQ